MTQQEPRQHPYPENYPPYEDEINLIDYLKVLWKWKWMIIGCTLICTIIAWMISLQMSKAYSIDMVLKPSILAVKEDNQFVYIDSVDNVKSLIESGAFENDILKSIKKSSIGENLPKSLNLKMTVPRGTKNLKISYETSDVELGVNVLKHLGKLLLERYDGLVLSYLSEKDAKINIFNTYEQNTQKAKKKIDELESEINLLIKKKNKVCLADGNENNVLLAVLYDNSIQQKMTLANLYWLELNRWIAKTENNKHNLLKLKKANIRKLQSIIPSVSNPHLIKPKKKQIVLLTGVVALFMAVFLAFFIEYIKNASKASSANKRT